MIYYFSLDNTVMAFEFLDLDFTHIYYAPSFNLNHSSKTMFYLPMQSTVGNDECIHSNFFNHILDEIFDFYQSNLKKQSHTENNNEETICITLQYRGFSYPVIVQAVATTSYDVFTFTALREGLSFDEFKLSLKEKTLLELTMNDTQNIMEDEPKRQKI